MQANSFLISHPLAVSALSLCASLAVPSAVWWLSCGGAVNWQIRSAKLETRWGLRVVASSLSKMFWIALVYYLSIEDHEFFLTLWNFPWISKVISRVYKVFPSDGEMDQVPHIFIIFILTLYLNGLYNSPETWFAREMPHSSSWKKILLSVCSVKLHLLPRLTVQLPAQDVCSPSFCAKMGCDQPDNESSAWLLNKAGIQSALREYFCCWAPWKRQLYFY